jgi:hypothetical protein
MDTIAHSAFAQQGGGFVGALGGIRTPNLLIRSQNLACSPVFAKVRFRRSDWVCVSRRICPNPRESTLLATQLATFPRGPPAIPVDLIPHMKRPQRSDSTAGPGLKAAPV